MAFKKYNNNIKVGDKCITTKVIGNFRGDFEIGTEVTVIEIGDRGYDVIDNKGNKVIEIGWTGLKLKNYDN